MELEELGDKVLSKCLERDSGDRKFAITAQEIKMLFRADDYSINRLKGILSNYGEFYGEGYDAFTWSEFRLNDLKFAHDGGFDGLTKREKKQLKRELFDKWLDRILGLIR